MASLLVLTALGCAASRPVLYPNQHLQTVGSAAAQQDIAECLALAEDFRAGHSQATDAAGNVAKTAAIGAAAGAAGGAVRGRAGRGAATGAAAAGAGATMREVFRSRQPDSVTKGYVDRCLRERGYNVIGWE